MPRVELPPLDDSTYARLKHLLHPAPPQVVELSIFPSSSSPPTIQYDPDPSSPALAIPKPLLVACFLRARSILVTAQQTTSRSTATDGILQSGAHVPEEVESEEIYGATSVLLLLEPNHQTAANRRKHRLLCLRRQLSRANLQHALRVEWTFITSLLTSPLPPHHAKSTTLWYHRLWLIRNFSNVLFDFPPFEAAAQALVILPSHEQDRHSAIQQKLWQEELGVIMHAGDRHPRNYYGWRYARDLWRWVLEHLHKPTTQFTDTLLKIGSKPDTGLRLGQVIPESTSTTRVWPEQFDGMWSYAVLEVHRWCLQHPSDVSGWSFLAHLLRDLELPSHTENILGRTHASKIKMKEEIVSQTINFTQKYSWKGESLNWFLTNMTKEQEMLRKGGGK